jgi:hypothetical protein
MQKLVDLLVNIHSDYPDPALSYNQIYNYENTPHIGNFVHPFRWYSFV